MDCDTCGTVRVIYSYNAVGENKRPTKNQLEELAKYLDNGYVCVNSINNNADFYVKIQLRCSNYIESQYYNPKYSVKGKKIVTEDICAI